MGAVQLKGGGGRIDDQFSVGNAFFPAGRTDAATETAYGVVEPFRIEDRPPIVVKAVIGGLHLGIRLLKADAQRVKFLFFFGQRAAEPVGTPVGPGPRSRQSLISGATNPATGVGPLAGYGFGNAGDCNLGRCPGVNHFYRTNLAAHLAPVARMLLVRNR